MCRPRWRRRRRCACEDVELLITVNGSTLVRVHLDHLALAVHWGGPQNLLHVREVLDSIEPLHDQLPPVGHEVDPRTVVVRAVPS